MKLLKDCWKRGELIWKKKLLFNIGPIWFDGTIVLMVLLTCIIVFAFVYACTRNMKLRPKGKQTVIEWLVDFIRESLQTIYLVKK